MTALRFKRVIKIIGVNPYVDVMPDEAARLKPDWRKPMPVLVQVNGHPEKPWHINMMPKGDGSFYLYLHGDVRKVSDTKVGDKVEVLVWFDNSYKEGPDNFMPDWFTQALAANRVAQTNWEKLPPSRQKEVARYLGSLKNEDAKQRNLEKVLRMLGGESGRFMARDWKDGK